MYTRPLFFLFVLSQVCAVGCHHRPCHKLWNNVCRTVKREPKCFDYCDRSGVFHEMACCYWSQNMTATPCSQHFRSGFLDGFADHLHRGGTGLAPVLPPRRYWEPTDGVRRQDVIAEWRAGFSAGAESAKESGMRDQVVMSYDGLPVSQKSVESMAPVVVDNGQFYGMEMAEPLEATGVTEPNAVAPAPLESVGVAAEAETPTTDLDQVQEAEGSYTLQTLPTVSEGEGYTVEEFAEPAIIERFDSPEPTIIHLSQDVDEPVL